MKGKTVMNLALKFKIYEKFGTQWRFARFIKMHESDVSRVIKGRRILSSDAKEEWAKVLGCKKKEIFNGSTNS